MNRTTRESEASRPTGLQACEAERIHVPGAIQPHGCLLACSLPAWTINCASANAGQYFGRDASSLLGLQLDDVLPHKTLHDLRNVLQSAMVSGSAERLVEMGIDDSEIRYDLTLHVAGPNAVIEVVPRAGADSLATDPVILVKSMIGRLKRAPTLDRLLSLAANQVRAVAGFDRVMIYQFLEDDSGQVVAESLRSGMTPLLGLRYPESDIPAEARALYKRQWLRLIPDVACTPVPLLIQPTRDGEVDLGLASLRSVSPIHLECLRDMGARAALTVSLIQGDRLWGLIACHHESPRRVSSSTAAMAELFGQILSLQIEAKEHARQLDGAARARQAHDQMLASMRPEETPFDNPARSHEALKQMIPCDGIGVWSDGIFSGAGATPPETAIPGLIRILDEELATAPFATDALGSILPSVDAGAGIAGVLAVPFSRTPRDYLLFFRREAEQTVTWARDPGKPIEHDDAGYRIGPRKSFEAWRETVRGRSLPWRRVELQIAETLRISLLVIILRRADILVRERKAAHEDQVFLIAELNHRARNVFTLIRSLVRQSRQGAGDLDDFANGLEQRVRALASAHDQLTSTGWRNTPLRKLLETEAKAWADTPTRMSFDGPPINLDSRAFQALALVVHEMMANAAKHGCLSRPAGRLSVTWSLDEEGGLLLEWRERGGPPVSAPKTRGFGSVVIERTIPFELGGRVEVRYLHEGVFGRFMVPAARVGEGEDQPDVVAVETRQHDLVLKRWLLVEDSMMIALDAQAMLREAGLDVEVAGTVADARRTLGKDTFDAAVLDIDLSGETSFGLADDLAKRRLRFVFATGYGESSVIPDRFKAVPIVSKPYDATALASALESRVSSDDQDAAAAPEPAGRSSSQGPRRTIP